jgi:hypothetical protein
MKIYKDSEAKAPHKDMNCGKVFFLRAHNFILPEILSS